MKKWHSEGYFLLSGLRGRWTPLLNPIYWLSRGFRLEFTSSRPFILILYIHPPAGFALPMFLLTVMPQKPLSSERQHHVIIIRPDGDNVTRLVYLLAACIQLQPLVVCDALPIMGSSNARSTSVACLVWLRSSVLSTGQPGRRSSLSTWTHPTSGDKRRSS